MQDNVAVIHDWLNGMRGGEKVLEQILVLYPQADIFTLFLEVKNISPQIRSHRIYTSSLNRYRLVRRHYRRFLPFFPRAIENFDLKNYRLIISSSHCVAKGVIPYPGATHISYIHSPMRYAWDQYHSYFAAARGIKRSIIASQMTKLRLWDTVSSARVDQFVANSSFVQQRIWQYYRRPSALIHPPVDTDFFQPDPAAKKQHFLAVTALVPYKNVSLLIETFNRCRDKLVIVGSGPEEKRLRRQARENIEFRGAVNAETLRRLYQESAALVFAGVEDFGIAFAEAQACGVPVIAYAQGGALDIVRHGETGFLFSPPQPESLLAALETCKRVTFNPAAIRQNSLRFSPLLFRTALRTFIEEKRK